jgi:hypothetical protein
MNRITDKKETEKSDTETEPETKKRLTAKATVEVCSPLHIICVYFALFQRNAPLIFLQQVFVVWSFTL